MCVCVCVSSIIQQFKYDYYTDLINDRVDNLLLGLFAQSIFVRASLKLVIDSRFTFV